MSSNDYLAPLVAKLTINGAINLRSAATNPCPLNPDAVHGKGTIFTGMGKWTTLAAIGVENHLKSLGLAEERPRRSMQQTGARRDNYGTYITPLGREMAQYLADNWDDLAGKFRDSGR